MDFTKLEELEIARMLFPNENFTLEDLELREDRGEKVFVYLSSSCCLSNKEFLELFKLCYKEFGESREHYVCVFRGAEGFYFTTDDDEALEMDEQEWIGTFCYCVLELDEKVRTMWYPEFFKDSEHEYHIEFDQYE